MDEGYTYVIEPSPHWFLCLLQKSSIDTMQLNLASKGYREWRVSGLCYLLRVVMSVMDMQLMPFAVVVVVVVAVLVITLH